MNELIDALLYLEANQQAFDIWDWDDLNHYDLEQTSLFNQIQELETRAKVTLLLPSTSKLYGSFNKKFSQYFGQSWTSKHIVHMLLARVLSDWNSAADFIKFSNDFIVFKQVNQSPTVWPVQTAPETLALAS